MSIWQMERKTSISYFRTWGLQVLCLVMMPWWQNENFQGFGSGSHFTFFLIVVTLTIPRLRPLQTFLTILGDPNGPCSVAGHPMVIAVVGVLNVPSARLLSDFWEDHPYHHAPKHPKKPGPPLPSPAKGGVQCTSGVLAGFRDSNWMVLRLRRLYDWNLDARGARRISNEVDEPGFPFHLSSGPPRIMMRNLESGEWLDGAWRLVAFRQNKSWPSDLLLWVLEQPQIVRGSVDIGIEVLKGPLSH